MAASYAVLTVAIMFEQNLNLQVKLCLECKRIRLSNLDLCSELFFFQDNRVWFNPFTSRCERQRPSGMILKLHRNFVNSFS